MKALDIIAGSIIGAYHLKVGKNNQDSFFVWESPEYAVVVVCDGCGSLPHAEIGSQLQSQFVGGTLKRKILNECPLDESDVIGMVEDTREEWMHSLAGIARLMGQDPEVFVESYALATLMVFVATPERVMLLTKGDGTYQVNGGRIHDIDQHNIPNYPGYQLTQYRHPDPTLVVRMSMPFKDFDSLLFGTDGIMYFEGCKDRIVNQTLVEGLDQFHDQKYRDNPALLQRRLWGLVVHCGYRVSPLQDDTTLVVVSRKYSKSNDEEDQA